MPLMCLDAFKVQKVKLQSHGPFPQFPIMLGGGGGGGEAPQEAHITFINCKNNMHALLFTWLKEITTGWPQ